jgi:alpha-beta hydrolase superfamily lysophospholipase
MDPSNPGLPAFYIPFLSIIRERLQDSSLAICVHGHIGHAHDLPQPKSDASLSLQAQIEAAAAVFRNLQREYPNTPFIFMGHSIGAYIALHVSLCHLLHFGHEIDLCRPLAGLFPAFG